MKVAITAAWRSAMFARASQLAASAWWWALIDPFVSRSALAVAAADLDLYSRTLIMTDMDIQQVVATFSD